MDRRDVSAIQFSTLDIMISMAKKSTPGEDESVFSFGRLPSFHGNTLVYFIKSLLSQTFTFTYKKKQKKNTNVIFFY
jgi:hypothetical protein